MFEAGVSHNNILIMHMQRWLKKLFSIEGFVWIMQQKWPTIHGLPYLRDIYQTTYDWRMRARVDSIEILLSHHNFLNIKCWANICQMINRSGSQPIAVHSKVMVWPIAAVRTCAVSGLAPHYYLIPAICCSLKNQHLTEFLAWWNYTSPWASFQIRKLEGCACAGNAGNVLPATEFIRNW